MDKIELRKELAEAKEQLKDYNKLIDTLRDKDDPKGWLTRLHRTVKRIDMLLDASEIRELAHPTTKPIIGKAGRLVKVRPCGEEYGDRTYLGIMIGDVALGSSIQITDDKLQLEWAQYNPAMYVPDLGQVIYGAGSWWGYINSEEELKEITDDDINNVWYVRLLKNEIDNIESSDNL